MNKPRLHIDFRLNGQAFADIASLLEAASTNDDLLRFLQTWFSESDTVIVQTSGSTGVPKSIKLNKSMMEQSAMASGLYFDLPAKTKALCCLPLAFIAGKMMVVRALTLGWDLHVVKPSSNPLKGSEHSYDFAAMIPMQAMNSLPQLSRIGKLIIGGGVLSNTLIEALQTIPTKAFATYGMTETITHIAARALNHSNNTNLSAAVYKALPEVNFSQDTRGCLVIQAPRVSQGAVVTNDVVELLSSTDFLWLGRYDNIINSGGVKLQPEVIEKKLSKTIQQRFFVAGIPDEVLGEKLVLVLEGNALEDLQDRLKLAGLDAYEYPKHVYHCSEFVETKTGKIQREATLKNVNSSKL